MTKKLTELLKVSLSSRVRGADVEDSAVAHPAHLIAYQQQRFRAV